MSATRIGRLLTPMNTTHPRAERDLVGHEAGKPAPVLTPKGAQFVVFAKAAYLECGSIALMPEGAVWRNDMPTGFVRYLTAAEAWEAGLPVIDALAKPRQ
jgi:hypothetical protein